MFIHKRAISLPQTPDGYQMTSCLVYPERLRSLLFALPLFVFLSIFELTLLGIISDNAFCDAIEQLQGLSLTLCVVFICLAAPLVRGIIQRDVSRLFGYQVSFHSILLSIWYGNTYTAVPGQWQRRRDVLIIASAPLIVYSLILLVLFCTLSGAALSIFASILILLASGTLCDLVTLWNLFKRLNGTFLYTESFLNIDVYEPLSDLIGNDVHPDETVIEDQPTPLELPWEVVPEEKMAGRKKIQKEDEDILVRTTSYLFISEFTKRGIMWITRLQASEIYTISTTAPRDFNTAVDSVITQLDANTHLIDIKLATEHTRPLLSLFPSNGTYEILDHPDEVRKRIAQSSSCEVKVLMGSGYMDLTPAIVTVQLQRRSVDQTYMEIQGVSKESLIRHHAGEKAVHSVVQWIEEQL